MALRRPCFFIKGLLVVVAILGWSADRALAHHSLQCIQGANNGSNAFLWGSNGSSYQSNSLGMSSSLESFGSLEESPREIKSAPPPRADHFPGKKASDTAAKMSSAPKTPPSPSPSPSPTQTPNPQARKLPDRPKLPAPPKPPEGDDQDGELKSKML